MPESDAEKDLKVDGPHTDSIAVPGSISSIKNLFQLSKDSDGENKWVDKPPENVPEPGENQETAKFAVIVRNIKSTDSLKTLEAHSIIIQSPWLKKALGRHVLKDYPGVTCELSRLEFQAPFKPFVHRWAELLNYKNRKNLDETMRKHVNLLYDVLKHEIGDKIKVYEDYVLTGVITYEHLWMIFQPGGTLISENGPMAAFELESSEYIKNDDGEFLRLKCEYVSWDGKQFGRGSQRIDLEKFRGTKNIQALEAVPLRFHDGKESVKRDLIDRGEKFESLAGHQYKA